MILITRQIDSKQAILVNFNYILQKKLQKAQFAMLELCREPNTHLSPSNILK